MREERTLDLFLAKRASSAVEWILAKFGIGLEVGIGRGDDRDAMLDSEGGEALEVRNDGFGAGHIEFPGWVLQAIDPAKLSSSGGRGQSSYEALTRPSSRRVG